MRHHLPALRYECSRWQIAPWSLLNAIDQWIFGELLHAASVACQSAFKSVMVIFELLILGAPQRIRNVLATDEDQAYDLAGVVDGAPLGLSAHFAFDEHRSARAARKHFAVARLAREVVGHDEVKLVVGRSVGRVDDCLAVGCSERHREMAFHRAQVAIAEAVEDDTLS